MGAKRISLNKVLSIIEGRRKVCEDAAARYAAAGEAHMAASERCAQSELAHIITLLLKDKTK